MKKTLSGKKVLALACAVALGVTGTALPVEAADVAVSQTGEMNYVDMSQYTKVLLPTSSTMAFALDPQGLSTMQADSVSTKDLVAAAGNIVSNGEVSVVNYGYYPLKVKTSFYVSDSGKSTLVENESEVENDTTRRVYLTVTPSQTATTVTTADTTDAKGVTTTNITGTAGYTASGEDLVITAKAAAAADGMVFALSGADYEFTKSTDETSGKVTYAAARKEDGAYGAAAFKIGGKINKNADWTAYTGKSAKALKLIAVFSYETITNDEYAFLTDTTNSLIQPGTYNMVQNNAPDFTGWDEHDVRLDASKGTSVGINLGSGMPAAKVKAVTLMKHLSKTPVAGGDAVVADTKIALASATANAAGDMLNIPALPAAVQTEIAKVDIEDTDNFDAATSTYTAIKYGDAKFNYEATYGLVVTLTDGTVSPEAPVTFIKYQAPTVEYTGADLVKVTKATANKAISTFTVSYGNGGATQIVKAVVNEAKSTATLTAVNNDKITVNATSFTVGAGAFSYTSGAGETAIVLTVTFDSGETADVVIGVL